MTVRIQALTLCIDRNVISKETGLLSRKEYLERGRFRIPDPSGVHSWSHPVIANGKLYVRDQGDLFCYDVKAKK